MKASDALRDAVAYLGAAGVPGPERDARLLLAHALDVKPDRLLLHLTEDLAEDAGNRFDAAIARRALREPVSHITGTRMFYGRAFHVSKHALDPRPETECLIEAALGGAFKSVLDLGLGTGCIIMTLLTENVNACGVGVDASAEALAVARANVDRFELADRVDLRQGDWFSTVTEQFDLIVSNPPYIAMSEIPTLSEEVSGHEPHIALTDFGDGLGAYRAICAKAPEHLHNGGRLLVEIGPSQGGDVCRLMQEAGLTQVMILPDLDGRDRVVSARKPE